MLVELGQLGKGCNSRYGRPEKTACVQELRQQLKNSFEVCLEGGIVKE
jgi:hypothetical protein